MSGLDCQIWEYKVHKCSEPVFKRNTLRHKALHATQATINQDSIELIQNQGVKSETGTEDVVLPDVVKLRLIAVPVPITRTEC